MRLVVMPGDGIGPEVTAATVRVIETLDRRLNLGITLETHEVGFARLKRDGTTLPSSALKAAEEAEGIILGPVSTLEYPPPDQGGINVSAALRKGLDLYANLRPARTRGGIPHFGRTEMDLVIARENTEGFYAVRTMYEGQGEFMPTEDLAFAIRKISAKASQRIARAAFLLAERRRRKVTAVHKANVLKMSEALFLREVRKVAAEFPTVSYDEQLVDSMAALLVRDARRFDVAVTTNMFGDILSDLASELSGSLGLGASVNAGDTHCMAQAQHGSAPDIAGQDKANPVSLILSAAMLLDWLGRQHKAENFSRAAIVAERAVDVVLERPETRTRDLGGKLGTTDFTKVLVDALGRALAEVD
jgi:3-isopropylmalate dehydrogenase